jgi:uncharacterized protein YutE (UPF0331/DUF86 family)
VEVSLDLARVCERIQHIETSLARLETLRRLPPERMQTYVQIVRFRNLVVHPYQEAN